MPDRRMFHNTNVKKKQKLNSGWQFLGIQAQSQIPDNINLPDSNDLKWSDIKVPGDINAALFEAGLIPDPHFDTRAQEAYWITSREWWYQNEFEISEQSQKIDICLTGIEGIADIWVNEKYLGCMRNAFRFYRFDISRVRKSGRNRVLIRFRSFDQFFEGERSDKLRGWFGKRTFLRKEQYSFGWDWSLPLPSIGLSQNVWLELDSESRLVDFSIQSYVSGRVDFSWEVSKAARNSGYEIKLEINGHGSSIRKTVSLEKYRSYISVNIENPKLWWPNGYGEPNLYDYSVELVVDDKLYDRRQGRFGIRESQIFEEPFTADAGSGFSFGLKINNEPIFCQGANWIPAELWPGTVTPEQYEFYLRKAKEANFNMLRVWGGGIYEADLFYELCDELGIMVWQDFMYGGDYSVPVDVLREEIKAESEYQLKRLRNYPSIVLWCGGNEEIGSWCHPSDMYDETAVLEQKDEMVLKLESDKWEVDRQYSDKEIFTMILRGLVSKYGLGVPYINSSPESRDDYGNSPSSGNSHISCWKYALFQTDGKYDQFRKHFDRVCSFNSEFCIQGPCSQKTIETFMAAENHWPPNDAWIYHIQRGHRNIPHYEQTIMIGEKIFGDIKSLESYVKYGQTVHAEMMRAEFESARRDRPNSGGTMVWMFNDCWPTSNWSIIDYYRRPKPAYYAAKRACEPLLPIIFERDGRIEFFFSNLLFDGAHAELKFGQETLYGKTAWSEEMDLTVNGNETVRFAHRMRTDLMLNMGDHLFIDAKVNGVCLKRVIYFPDAWKDISWPEPGVCIESMEYNVNGNPCSVKIKLFTESFGRMVHLYLSDNDKSSWFDDNYFDMSAGSRREIILESSERIDSASVKIGHWLTHWH